MALKGSKDNSKDKKKIKNGVDVSKLVSKGRCDGAESR